MAKKVTTIPATISKYTASPISSTEKRKVAAYARVSTDHEEQASSYEAQVDYYTRYIKSREDWEFVSVYADEGITGTSTRHRDGFNKMVEDALAGRIDLIITKSVSRFARNTVDSLTTIRRLKENKVECFFEKKDLWTEGVVKMFNKNQMSTVYQCKISSKNNAIHLIFGLFMTKIFFFRFAFYHRFIALRRSIKAFGV